MFAAFEKKTHNTSFEIIRENTRNCRKRPDKILQHIVYDFVKESIQVCCYNLEPHVKPQKIRRNHNL